MSQLQNSSCFPFAARAAVAAGLLVFGLLTASPAASAQLIKLSAAQEKALGLSTALAQPVQSAPIATLPGLFTPPPMGRSVVAAPFAGVVIQVAVFEGQEVRAGQTLATVFSRDALNESAGLGQARAEATVAAAAAVRTRQLAEEGIVAGARAAEADARAQAARSMLSAKAVSVSAAGVGTSGRYVLRAPFAGRVSSVDVAAGEGVDAMAPAFVVDRAGRIQVEATLPAALAGKVAPGARAMVEGATGRVIAVGSAIDPKTRSLSIRAEVEPRPSFIPGRATRLEIYNVQSAGGFSVPRSAVTTLGKINVVFVRAGGGFVATPVTVQGWSGDRATLSGPISAATAVAVTAVSELKAQAQAQ